MKENGSQDSVAIVVDIKRLLALFGGLILIFGLLFIVGHLAGHQTSKEGTPSGSVDLSQKKQASGKDFLYSECHIP